MSLRPLLARARQSRLARNVFKVAGGTALAHAILAALSPVFTRLYGPDEFATYGVFLSFVGTVGAIIAARYDVAMIAAKEAEERLTLLVASLVLVVPVALGLGGVLWQLRAHDVLSYGVLPAWAVPATVLFLLALGWQTAMRYHFVGRGEFGLVSRVIVAQGIGRAVLTTACGLAPWGWLGLFLGELAGRGLGLRVQARAVAAALRGFRPPAGAIRRTLTRYWKYPVLSLPSTLVDSMAAALPIPLVATAFGMIATGHFTLVQRLGAIPAGLVGAAVGDALQFELTRHAAESPDQLRACFVRVARTLALGSAPLGLLAMVLGPPLFGYVFGREWADAGLLVSILTPMMCASLVASPLSRSLAVVDRPELKLIYDASAILATVLPIVLGERQGLGFLTTMVWFSAAQTATSVIYGCICYWAVVRCQARLTAARGRA